MGAKVRSGLFFIAAFLCCALAGAKEDIHGDLAELPVVAESPDRGILVDLLKAMQKYYTDGTLSFDVIPFKRSLQSVTEGHSDFHAPILKDPSKSE